MPATPKPAPAPAPPVAALPTAPSPSLPVRHYLAIGSHGQTVEAVIERPDGQRFGSGLLLVHSLEQLPTAMELSTQIAMAHAAAEPLAAPAPVIEASSPPIQLQQAPAPAPAPAPMTAPPVVPPSDAPATPEVITEIQATIQALPPEWQDYLMEMFRIEFGLPAGRKLSTAIKSQAHCEFLLSKIPQPGAAA